MARLGFEVLFGPQRDRNTGTAKVQHGRTTAQSLNHMPKPLVGLIGASLSEGDDEALDWPLISSWGQYWISLTRHHLSGGYLQGVEDHKF